MVAAATIEPYTGDFEDVAELTARAWAEAYGGTHRYLLWDAAFLRWQFGRDPARLSVAAYRDGALVGAYLATPHDVRVHGTNHRSALCSWCVVAPEHRDPGLAIGLINALGARLKAHGCAFGIGFVSGDEGSLADRFWRAYSRTYPDKLRFAGALAAWVRVLNPRRFSAAMLAGWERISARLLGPAANALPLGAGLTLRPYRDDDLEACASALKARSAGADWTLDWSTAALSEQLQGPVTNTVVLDRDGRPQAFANYHGLALFGRSRLSAAMVDLIADAGLGLVRRTRFLAALCRHLRRQGYDLVMAVRGCLTAAPAFLANMFVPMPGVGRIATIFPQTEIPAPAPNRLVLPLR
ncbi:MAG: GNAT family N-acetyltransferase [Rhodobacter sp.]|nr:GNAT family N-acetyltransferase [Rhodobacter sp.]